MNLFKIHTVTLSLGHLLSHNNVVLVYTYTHIYPVPSIHPSYSLSLSFIVFSLAYFKSIALSRGIAAKGKSS